MLDVVILVFLVNSQLFGDSTKKRSTHWKKNTKKFKILNEIQLLLEDLRRKNNNNNTIKIVTLHTVTVSYQEHQESVWETSYEMN